MQIRIQKKQDFIESVQSKCHTLLLSDTTVPSYWEDCSQCILPICADRRILVSTILISDKGSWERCSKSSLPCSTLSTSVFMDCCVVLLNPKSDEWNLHSHMPITGKEKQYSQVPRSIFPRDTMSYLHVKIFKMSRLQHIKMYAFHTFIFHWLLRGEIR